MLPHWTLNHVLYTTHQPRNAPSLDSQTRLVHNTPAAQCSLTGRSNTSCTQHTSRAMLPHWTLKHVLYTTHQPRNAPSLDSQTRLAHNTPAAQCSLIGLSNTSCTQHTSRAMLPHWTLKHVLYTTHQPRNAPSLDSQTRLAHNTPAAQCSLIGLSNTSCTQHTSHAMLPHWTLKHVLHTTHQPRNAPSLDSQTRLVHNTPAAQCSLTGRSNTSCTQHTCAVYDFILVIASFFILHVIIIIVYFT